MIGVVQVTGKDSSKFVLPKELASSTPGILISSTDDIIVFGASGLLAECYSFPIFPVNRLSNSYYAMTFLPHMRVLQQYESQIVVVATVDRTLVKFSLPAFSHSLLTYYGQTYTTGLSFEVLLSSRLNTVQVRSLGDTSGLEILSNAPIGVFSELEEFQGGNWDTAVAKLIPVEGAGVDYIVPPFPNAESYFLKILAISPDTEVRMTGKDVVRLTHSGSQVYEIFSRNEFIKVTSSKPILVGQFAVSFSLSMIHFPVVKDQLNAYHLILPIQADNRYKNNTVRIITDAVTLDNLHLDGQSLPETKWTTISGKGSIPDLRIATFNLSDDFHVVFNAVPNSVSLVFVFGSISRQTAPSYVYSTGMCFHRRRRTLENF